LDNVAHAIGDPEWVRKNQLLLKMIGQWSLLLTRMGLTYTSQQYIPVKEREVETAAELIELQNKLSEFAKEKEKLIKKRINVGGARRPKNGPPITIRRKKKVENE